MRTPSALLFIAVSAAAAALSLPVQAQTPKQAPPSMQKLEEGDAPAITIRKQDSGKKVIEKREQGVVTDVKVQSGKQAYHVKQSAGPGNAAPGDAQSGAVRAAQWEIKEFDLGRKKVAPKPVEEPQTVATPPSIKK